MKRRWLAFVVAPVAILLGIELVAGLLQRPNRVDPGANSQFLITTQWHQVGDYARSVSLDDDTGCWATAIAQIGHFHQVMPVGAIEYETSSGSQVRIDLDSFDFDHAIFVDEIDSDTTGEARDQVAEYIYAVACILHTDFGASGYLEHETFVDRVEGHLGCAVAFHEYDKARFLEERDEITALVRREIRSERPLMLYFDNGKDFGHAAVVDGFIDTNGTALVHLNMGWGGRHDGWYDLFERFIGVRDDLQNRFLITITPR